MELPSAPVLGFKEALVGLKASELQKGVAERSKGPLVSDSGDSISGDAVKLVSMGALVGTGLRSRALRAARAQRAQRARVPRRLFGNMEQLNPFYEAPEKQTQKRYEPQVQAINALEETMKAKSDDQLRALTADLQQRAQSGTPLEELLPEAFALVREGSTRVLGLRHFDVQLMGGIALHEGNIAEMGTGEGKTLVAILAAFLNALSGKGVHVVTVNDYLARRDAEWVGQPLRFLGMTVGVVQNGMPPDQKKKAYRNDVTYVTNSELGFDYLRDQMAPSPSELALREQTPFNFAVVDEVDSILIDEARTPLIISGVADNTPTKYKVAQEVVRALKPEVHYTVDEKQRQCVLIEGGVEAAEKLLGKDDLFDPEDPWFPFVTNALNAKELYIKDKAYIVKRGEVMIVDEFTGRVMEGRRWSNGLHQAIEAKENVQIQAESVTLASISYQSLFRLFDKLSGMTGTAFTEAKEFEEVYKLKTVVVPPNLVRKRADKDDQVYVDDIGKWKAVAREVENAHRIGRPVLIGTTNVENSEIIAELLDALGVAYQLLNAKPENVARETEIVASSGRKYAVTIATNMAGRGTDILLGGNPSMMARLRLREELYSKLFPKKSWAMPEEFYPVDLTPELEQQVSNAVSQTVEAWKPKETDLKPTSLEAAEQIVSQGKLSELDAEERLSLACEKAPTEDEVILQLREAYKALAAHYKQITDLEKDEVRALGGLLVLGTERHESRRIDNQLRGRCARQGDPGATRFFLSLNDTIFRIFGGDNIKKMMSMMSLSQRDDVPLESGLLSNSLEEAQKKVENYFYSVRKNVFEYDDVMDTQRKIVYGLRRRALLDPDDNIRSTMMEFSDRNMEDFATGHIDASKPVNEWLLDKLAENVKVYCALLDPVTPEKLREVAGGGGPAGAAAVTAYLQEEAQKAFYRKLELIEGAGPGLTAMVTRQVLLMQLDTFWQQHLKNMDFMKSGMTLRAYGQKNPLTEYKLEGYQVFLKMMSKIRRNALYNVFLFQPRKLTPMSRERVKGLIPNRETRRRQVGEIKKSESYKVEKEAKGITMDKGAAARSMNLARLSLNVRQVLEAREGLGELALASFSELKDTFARSGLLTLGDQLMWAQACSEFELLEDELAGEVYIGLVGRMEPQAAKAPPETNLEDMDIERFEERQREAQKLFESAQEDPNFVQTLAAFSNEPELFLKELKAASQEQGWTREDVKKMKETYAMMGINLEVMLQEMQASADALPPAQRDLVAYMQQMLTDPDSVLQKAEELCDPLLLGFCDFAAKTRSPGPVSSSGPMAVHSKMPVRRTAAAVALTGMSAMSYGSYGFVAPQMPSSMTRTSSASSTAPARSAASSARAVPSAAPVAVAGLGLLSLAGASASRSKKSKKSVVSLRARGGEEDTRVCIPLEELRNTDVEKVGGKSASLGEMISQLSDVGVPVPGGFSTTAFAYKEFLDKGGINEFINDKLSDESIYEDVDKLMKVGKEIRDKIMDTPFQEDFEEELKAQWQRVSGGDEKFTFAVRSSATAEDLPDASFAGQQETFLNVMGYKDMKEKVHLVFASLFTDRAISYRHDRGFEHEKVQLCATCQKMVRSETGSAGVMFSLDTESGFKDVVFVTSAYGLGETVVGGTVNPDEWYVFKPTLAEGKNSIISRTMGSKLCKMIYKAGGGSETVDTSDEEQNSWSASDEEVKALAEMAVKIEKHYGRPMDIEWARDGDDGKLYIVQARPETVASQKKVGVIEEYKMLEKGGEKIAEGRAVGKRIGSGEVNILTSIDQMSEFSEGEVLVADMTDPDWEPIMKKAGAIITNRGGRTCHAAIIARELGIPAIVGCGDATDRVSKGDKVTVSCAEGDTGYIYKGELKFEKKVQDLGELPEVGLKIMMNVGNPETAFAFGQLPNEGIGLARLEFVINNAIGVHPKALLNYDTLDGETKELVDERMKGYDGPKDFYVKKIAEGVATLAASVYPKRIIVRLSDFKSNEYKSLIGGEQYEPDEENPMIGFRGCGRYTDPFFEECFAMELEAVKMVRGEMGLKNVEIMIPFVRTLDMAKDVSEVLEKNGLKRGEDGLKVNMMAELPSNVFLAEEFLEYFDGFSIGSNDLTQLTLGLDRDSGLVAQYFDERNPAVMKGLETLIKAAKKKGKYVGICGQGPSDHPDLAKWLMEQGIDSVSLNPDSVIPTWQFLAKK